MNKHQQHEDFTGKESYKRPNEESNEGTGGQLSTVTTQVEGAEIDQTQKTKRSALVSQSFLNSQSISANKKYKAANDNWLAYMWETQPEILFDYTNIGDYSKQKIIPGEDNYLILEHPEFKYNAEGYHHRSNYLGWKLHINIDNAGEPVDAIKQLFNLSAPILAKYKMTFKVSYPRDNVANMTGHLWDDAQITIYLQRDDKLSITPDLLAKMLSEVTSALKQAQIKPGVKPQSDAETISVYFSIRNDYDDIHRKLFTQNGIVGLRYNNYLPACDVGAQHNPLAFANPFASVLGKPETTKFSLCEHFNAFGKSVNFDLIILWFEQTLMAYLKKYTTIDSIRDLETIQELLAKVKSSTSDFPMNFLKHSHDESIIKSIEMSVFILDYLINGHVYGLRPDFKSVHQLGFARYYDGDDELLELLKAVDQAIFLSKLTEDYEIVFEPVSFEKYLEVVERWFAALPLDRLEFRL